MRQYSDTLTTEGFTIDESADSVVVVKHKLTPKEVISWLPKDATPEQQDSAVQAHFQPAPIHWSERPDTLHFPGEPPPKDLLEVNLPQYYRQSFFSDSPYFHPELPGGRLGVAGDPIPYSIAGDNVMTSVLLVCFVLTLVSFARSRHFVIRQLKDMFRETHGTTTEITETASELRFQFFLVVQTCAMLSILCFSYVQTYVGETFTIDQYLIMALYAGVFMGYFTVRTLLYTVVDNVFFSNVLNRQWVKFLLFVTAMEGVTLYPLVLLQAYFSMDVHTSLVVTVCALVMFKLLTFYKAYIVFFRQIGGFLQIIVYLCALEIVPLLTLWGVLAQITSELKINF